MERAVEARVSDEARAGLRALVLGRNTSQKVALRARIVLLTAEGVPTAEIVRQAETTYPTVTRWRKRYARDGITGLLKDAPRPGRKPRISERRAGV